MVRYYFYLCSFKAQLSGPPAESVSQLTSFKYYCFLLEVATVDAVILQLRTLTSAGKWQGIGDSRVRAAA